MYTKEQKERALKEFERLGSVQAVVTLLGYPSRHTLYEWYRKKIADITDYHGSLDKEYIIKQKYINKPNHPRNPDISCCSEGSILKSIFSLFICFLDDIRPATPNFLYLRYHEYILARL